MNKTISLKRIFFVSLCVAILLSITLKHCIDVRDIEAAKEAVETARDVYSVVQFAKNVKKVSDKIEETQTVNTTTTTSNEEPDSSEYYKYYTKEQLTELKRICLPRLKKDGNGAIEYHAIEQAVFKWVKGIRFEEFMETATARVIPHEGSLYRITEKWTTPVVEYQGVYRAATIYRTRPKFFNLLKNSK